MTLTESREFEPMQAYKQNPHPRLSFCTNTKEIDGKKAVYVIYDMPEPLRWSTFVLPLPSEEYDKLQKWVVERAEFAKNMILED